MNFFNKIINFFKRIFIKENPIKMIEESKSEIQEQKNNFRNYIKAELVEKKKKNKIETLVCVGDGLRNKRKNDILNIK